MSTKGLLARCMISCLLAAVMGGTALRAALAEPLRIVSFEIGDGIQTEDGGGLYGQALVAILTGSGLDVDFSVLPLQRAFDTFGSRSADCIWAIDRGVLAKAGITGADLLESDSLFTSELHIFMPPGEPPLRDLRDLEGKSLGVSIGAVVPAVLQGITVDYVEVRSMDIKVRMLQLGRLDAIAAWVPDVLVAFHNNDIDPTAYNPALPLTESNVGLVCWDLPATRSFLHAVTPRIEAFRRSGALEEILRNYGIPFPNG